VEGRVLLWGSQRSQFTYRLHPTSIKMAASMLCLCFKLGSNVLKDKIWNSQARKAGACAKVEGCVHGLRAERCGVCVWRD
jgi:hypothetical protein